MVKLLQKLGGNEEMLGDILDKSIHKHAAFDPTKLFSFLPSILKAAAHPDNRGNWDGTLHQQAGVMLGAMAEGALELGPAALHQLLDKVPLNTLKTHVNRETAIKLQLALKKAARTKDDEDFDDENDRFIFIARPSFKETPEGSGNFRKSLEIENLVKVDPYDAHAHQMGNMMKMRAMAQGEGSEVYVVSLPKDVTNGGQPEEWLIDLIDKHKHKLR